LFIEGISGDFVRRFGNCCDASGFCCSNKSKSRKRVSKVELSPNIEGF
jgi:hypothetical protein